MRDEGFRRAMNAASPTPEQKARMRAALESQLPQMEWRRYQGRPEKSQRFSWLPAVAALLAVAIGGGLALMKGTLPASQKPNNSAVESLENAQTASLETLLSSPEYQARLAMERDDTDQLNALARQYGLTVETDGADTDGWELASQVGIRRDVRGGRYYSATGSSSFDGVMSMENADWIYPIHYRVCYNAKGAVVPELPVLDDAEAYRVWSYVTSDGASLVLALSLDNAVIYGQTGDGFYVVYTESNRGWDEAKREHNMEQKDLEAFAETFLFPMNTAGQISEGLEALYASPEYQAQKALAQKLMESESGRVYDIQDILTEYGLRWDSGSIPGEKDQYTRGENSDSARYEIREGRSDSYGSYSHEGTTTMEYAGSPWPYPIDYRLCVTPEGVLNDMLPLIGDRDSYTQWSYTNADGLKLTLGISPEHAVIYYRTSNEFYLVYVADNQAAADRTMDQSALEAFAETFLFPMNTAGQISEGLEALYASPEYMAEMEICRKLQDQGEQADKKAIYQETMDAFGLKGDTELHVGLLNDYIRSTDSRPVQSSIDSKSGRSDSYGSYFYVGTTTMDYPGSPWPYPIEYRFCVNPKGVYFAGLPTIGNINSYEQWSYTNSDGMALTLALSPYDAVIYVPASGGFYLVTVSVHQKETDHPMDRKSLEAFAETFRFPQDARGILAAGEEQYAAILAGYKDVMEGGSGKWQKKTAAAIRVRGEKFFGYAFRDLDGDGSDELLMTGGSNVYAVYAGRGEQAHAILKDDGVTQYELCQDGTIFQMEDYALKAYRVEKGTLTTIENVQAQSDPSSPWVRITENGPTAISYEEYRQVRNRYHSDTIPFTPLYAWKGYKEYVENRLLGTVDPDTIDPAYEAMIEAYRMAITQGVQPAEFAKLDISLGIASVEAPLNTIGWCLRDLDGNGEDELIITDGGTLYGVYTLENGKAKSILRSWERCRYYLREDGYLYSEGSGGAAVTYYEFIRLENGRMFTEELLVTDYSADPESPWFQGGTGADDVLKPVTEEEFNQALSAHGEIRKDLPFTPLSQH